MIFFNLLDKSLKGVLGVSENLFILLRDTHSYIVPMWKYPILFMEETSIFFLNEKFFVK